MKETIKLIFDEGVAGLIASIITKWITKKFGPITKKLEFKEVSVTPGEDNSLDVHIDIKGSLDNSKIFSLVLKKLGL